jgi:hypothetical protein
MPGATVPHASNKLIYGFDLTLGGQNAGRLLIAGNIEVGKRSVPILDPKSNNAVSYFEFHEQPKITGQTLDIHPDVLTKTLGITASDESAGLEDILDEQHSAPLIDSGQDHEHGYWVNLNHGRGLESPIDVYNSTDIIVRNFLQGGSGDTFIENTDYIIDYALGRISFPAASGIDDSEVLYISYAYTTVDAKVFSFPKGIVSTEEEAILTKTFPKDGETLEIKLWKAIITGAFQIPFGEDFSAVPLEITGLQDDDHAGAEFGYMKITN